MDDYSDGDDDGGVIYIDSSEDNLYSEDDHAADDDDDHGFAAALDDTDTSKRSQKSHLVLKEEDIRKHQMTDIEQVSTILSISQVEAIVLLLHYKWNAGKVEDEWFTDEDKVRNSVGLLKEPVVVVNETRGVNNTFECGICFESYVEKEIARVSCGHPYCKTCWTCYITSKINDGPVCLNVKCPEPSCPAVVGKDMVNKVISKEEDREKYERFFFRSYVEASGKKIKWCPSPGCDYAVDFLGSCGSDESENYDVSCLCSYDFCWKCGEEAHRPVNCDTVSKWIFKNKDESENTTWILANTKPCPNCQRQIEKNQGCNHMYCTICKHRFCWNCLRPLTNHKSCHTFEGDKKEVVTRERAKKAIDRYIHYYERWASNQSSRLVAMADLKKVQSVVLKKLSVKQGLPETHLRFIVDAWLQIVECRRVLKWTYAYGYYLAENEPTKKQLFEYLQGEAEVGLERLHHCAEAEFEKTVNESEGPSKDFLGYRMKLIGFTKATKTYFENLVKALENDLVEVNESNSKTNSKAQKNSKTNSKAPTKRRKLV
ncbi:unnamed protein product [Microthlaspi erraticum]|uniref:RBR-type E3 ubiquitin transferase n=1 Tax=Microthlaspi erraticum TaxID=1685480 RepID=A0A6D2JNG9_9BRAS|nr:unnamed protein product [Microthlaspi erraticum]